MIQPVRSALLFAAALTATNIAPAQAGSNSDSLLTPATVSLPPVAIDELLDPNNQPQLADPDADAPADPLEPADAAAEPKVPSNADLSTMVASLRGTSGRFPSSYCGVLFQCSQFSFIRGKSLPSAPRSSKQWQNAVAIAKIVSRGLKESSVGKALFFHARHVSPRWRLKRVASIGNHIFYR